MGRERRPAACLLGWSKAREIWAPRLPNPRVWHNIISHMLPETRTPPRPCPRRRGAPATRAPHAPRLRASRRASSTPEEPLRWLHCAKRQPTPASPNPPRRAAAPRRRDPTRRWRLAAPGCTPFVPPASFEGYPSPPPPPGHHTPRPPPSADAPLGHACHCSTLPMRARPLARATIPGHHSCPAARPRNVARRIAGAGCPRRLGHLPPTRPVAGPPPACMHATPVHMPIYNPGSSSGPAQGAPTAPGARGGPRPGRPSKCSGARRRAPKLGGAPPGRVFGNGWRRGRRGAAPWAGGEGARRGGARAARSVARTRSGAAGRGRGRCGACARVGWVGGVVRVWVARSARGRLRGAGARRGAGAGRGGRARSIGAARWGGTWRGKGAGRGAGGARLGCESGLAAGGRAARQGRAPARGPGLRAVPAA
jgi:hypothetical protein